MLSFDHNETLAQARERNVRDALFEDIGRQMLTYGARTEPEALVKQIEAVTAADLTKVATKLLKSPPSIVVVGDTTAVPRYDIIAKALA